jgi:hypothetical protein
MVRKLQIRGRCDSCGKQPRVLVRIESGQRICRTCLRRLRVPKERDPKAPASDELLCEAYRLGVHTPADATYGQVLRMVRLARRCLPVTEEFVNADFDRLVRFQDDLISYVADAWEQITRVRPAQPEVPGPEQQTFAALLILKYRPMAQAMQRVEMQRQRLRRELEDEHAAMAPPGTPFDWDAVKPPIAEDETYARLAPLLREQWKEYLPQRPKLFSRWLRGRQAAAGSENEDGPTRRDGD